MDPQSRIDYLVVGHICHDITVNGLLVGGTAAYSSAAAQVLGCRTGVLTSSKLGENWQETLPGIAIHLVPSEQTTTFENVYTPEGRVQTLHAVADVMQPEDVPEAWQRTPIVHLGPICNEINPEMISLFSNSIVGLTSQGWMRRWDDRGHVFARRWEAAKRILPLAAVTIISEEDLLDDDMLDQYREWAPLLVLTRGYNGCTVFIGDEERHFDAPKVREVEFTGAGDIYATAFLVRFWQTGGNPWEAARFATEIASYSITAVGLPAKMKVLGAHMTEHYQE